MKKIAIIHGEPNSINTEIIVKSWKKLNNSQKKSLFIIGNKKLLTEQIKRLKFKIGVNLLL